MSTLKTNTLTGTTSAGSILVTGEGGSTTTNLQQGLAKAWFNVDQTSGAVLDGSFNVASVADNSTGDFTITLTNNLNDANEASVPVGARNAFLQLHDSYITTSTVEFLSRDANPAVNDIELNTGCILGDLA